MKGPGSIFPFIFGQLFKKIATVNYPTVKAVMPESFRGKIKFDAPKCIGCKICMRDCPSMAIEIEKVAEKQFKCYIYLDRCIFCAQCVDSCPKDALSATKEFELAGFNRDKMKVEI
jgi:formate hydrogenlyase subunit 6/NADH:ubiquinone oxidoreductase subunit I